MQDTTRQGEHPKPVPDETWRGGEEAPVLPGGEAGAALLGEDTRAGADDRYAVARLKLDSADETAARALVEELSSEPVVLATSYDRDGGPAAPDELDVLVSPGHDPEALGAALVGAPRVRGAAVTEYAVPTAPAPSEPDDGPPDGVEAAFDQLKREVDPVGYDALVDEMDDEPLRPDDGGEPADMEALLDDLAEGTSAATAGSSGNARPAGSHDSATAGRPEDGATAGGGSTGDESASNSASTGFAVGVANSPLLAADASGADGAGLDPDAVLSALLTALEAQSLSADQRARVRSALGIEGSASLEARLDNLARQVEELSAYTGALEEFLGESGDGTERIRELETRVETLSAEVASLEEATRTLAARMRDQDDRVAAVEDDLASSTERDRVLARRVDSVETEATEEIDQLAERIERLSVAVGNVQAWQDQLADALADE